MDWFAYKPSAIQGTRNLWSGWALHWSTFQLNVSSFRAVQSLTPPQAYTSNGGLVEPKNDLFKALWGGYDSPDARARTGLIMEAAMVDRISAAGERYVLVSKRGRKSRTGSSRCFEDGLGGVVQLGPGLNPDCPRLVQTPETENGRTRF